MNAGAAVCLGFRINIKVCHRACVFVGGRTLNPVATGSEKGNKTMISVINHLLINTDFIQL